MTDPSQDIISYIPPTQAKENPMLNNIRRAKQFVQDHKTISACAATAVVTAVVMHDRDMRTLKAIAAQQMLKQDEVLAMLLDTTSFIDGKGLSKEFFDFAPRMRGEIDEYLAT